MRWAQQLQLRFRALFFRDRAEYELAEELQVHIEEQTAAYIRTGMSGGEARQRALLEFGGVEQMKEECRDARGIGWIENLFRDIQYGLRMLRKSPGFTAAAVLTLALGIGANTAIFSVVNAVLLRPLPYKDPSRLVQITESHRKTREISVNYLDFRDWQQQSKTFEQFAAFATRGFNLTGAGEPDRLPGRAVTANFLFTLGVKPFLGRDFLPGEDRPGGEPVVLLTHDLWLDRFGGERSLVGKVLTLNGHNFTVAGILPAEVKLPISGQIFSLLGQEADELSDRNSHPGIYVMGRMKPGVKLEEARAEMNAIAGGLEQAYPNSNASIGVILTPLREVFVADARTPILVLMAAVSFVLLISCFNVANLQLARAASREREFAIRRAIGASRVRILRQLLTESVLLALLGAALGLLLAVWMLASLTRLLPPGVTRVIPVSLDGSVLIFTTLIAALSGILFGLVPGLHASDVSLQETLKESTRAASAGVRRRLFRHLLVISEIALSLVLLLSAGLMIRSLRSLSEVNPGFDAQNVLTMKISLPETRYPTDDAVRNFYALLLERTAQLPGVKSTAVVKPLPLSGEGWQDGFYLETEPIPAPGHLHSSDYHYASPGYFQAMGIPLLKGRDFTASDEAFTPPVAAVSEGMARQYWPNEEPIGKRFHMGHPGSKEGAWMTVIGVVGDTKQYGLETMTKTEFYVSYRQKSMQTMTLLVRTASNPLGMAEAVKRIVQAVDSSQPVYQVRTMEQLLEEDGATRQTSSFLLGVFAAIATALAAIGIYGVMSYSVAERTHEVGVRMALGAQPGDVLRLLIGQGVRQAAIGVALGLAGALAAAPLLKDLLFGVSPTDGITFALVPLLLACVALLACYLPTRRATRVDAMVALRYE